MSPLKIFRIGIIGFSLCCHATSAVEKSERAFVTYEERSRLDSQPLIFFAVRYPPGKKAGDHLDGLVAEITHETEPESVLKRLKSRRKKPLYLFADKNNLGVISWTTQTLYSTSNSFRWTEQQARSSRNAMNIAAKEWREGFKDICRKYGLPEKNLLIYGISRGAQWAHRLALRYPEHFLAVHAHVNSSYEMPVEDARSCLWLISTGELEWGYPNAVKFFRMAESMGYPILFKAEPNLGHRSSPRTTELGIAFFQYALDLKKKYDDYVEKMQQENFNSELNLPKKGFPPEFLKGFREPPYFGDYINEEVVPAAAKESIPDALRVGLPSREVAMAYGFMAR